MGSAAVVRFAYDGAGERVLSWRRGADGRLMDARLYLRDEEGNVLTELEWVAEGTAGYWARARDHVYLGRDLIGTVDRSSGEAHVVSSARDHLGSQRAEVWTLEANTATDLWPYGSLSRAESAGAAPALSNGAHLFTGHERDFVGTTTDPRKGLDSIHARYYAPTLGRFLSVDPVGGEPGLSQSWNRYTYVRGNPVNAVDPDGCKIRIGSKGNAEAIREYLTSLMTRPSGRAHLEALARAPKFEVVYQDGHLNSRAQVALIQRTHQDVKLTFGTTTPVRDSSGEARWSGAVVSIDTAAVERLHYDRSGVAIIDHENYHARDLMLQKSLEGVAAGDEPTSESGPAEAQGRATASEKPDISRQEAMRRLKELLGESGD